jgi:hypothetical protein
VPYHSGDDHDKGQHPENSDEENRTGYSPPLLSPPAAQDEVHFVVPFDPIRVAGGGRVIVTCHVGDVSIR